MILALILAAQVTQFPTNPTDATSVSQVSMVGPHFQRSPKGWLPTCPAGLELIRHDPAPDCFWGTTPMHVKPTEGDFECVPVAQASKLKACPAE